jgi:hypothetical protein
MGGCGWVGGGGWLVGVSVSTAPYGRHLESTPNLERGWVGAVGLVGVVGLWGLQGSAHRVP